MACTNYIFFCKLSFESVWINLVLNAIVKYVGHINVLHNNMYMGNFEPGYELLKSFDLNFNHLTTTSLLEVSLTMVLLFDVI